MGDTKSFDPYEFVAVIAPGSVVGLALLFVWPELHALTIGPEVTVGGLGLFVILAFVVGHLLQSIGNALEAIVWMPRGKPTAWVRYQTQKLISDAQRDQLTVCVAQMEQTATPLEGYNRNAWAAVVRRMYGRVKAADRSARVDAFNRTYGLLRGVSSSFLVVLAIHVTSGQLLSQTTALLALALIVSLARMIRFSLHYARCLFLEFIDLPPTTS